MMMTAQEKLYLTYLFLAYSGLFVIMFGFLFKMLRNSRELLKQAQRLQEEWHGQPPHSAGETVTPVAPSVRGREV